jgi:flavin reductase (DIM6/NTAB) family NADH-FMN oxidoreductase RutF
MADSNESHPKASNPAAALGRVPSGLFILTVRHGDRVTGMLASWVQQAGFEPPMLTVALQKDRFVVDWVRSSGRFVLNQVPAGNKSLLRHFAKGFAPSEPAFKGVAVAREELAGPVLAEALGHLEVELVDEVTGGDHVVILGRIVGGGLIHEEAQPMIHVRRNGLHY